MNNSPPLKDEPLGAEESSTDKEAQLLEELIRIIRKEIPTIEEDIAALERTRRAREQDLQRRRNRVEELRKQLLPLPPTQESIMSLESEAMNEWARNIGDDPSRINQQWLLHDRDVWVRNPHYAGPEQRHPEDDSEDPLT